MPGDFRFSDQLNQQFSNHNQYSQAQDRDTECGETKLVKSEPEAKMGRALVQIRAKEEDSRSELSPRRTPYDSSSDQSRTDLVLIRDAKFS